MTIPAEALLAENYWKEQMASDKPMPSSNVCTCGHAIGLHPELKRNWPDGYSPCSISSGCECKKFVPQTAVSK